MNKVKSYFIYSLLIIGSYGLSLAQQRNVFSISSAVVDIYSSQGSTSLSLNSRFLYEYDRSISPLMSISPKGNLMAGSNDNTTNIVIEIGSSLRFWLSKNFSGFYLGPGINILLVNEDNFNRTLLGVYGDMGYRFIIKDSFAINIGGNLGVLFGQRVAAVNIKGIFSMGYAF